MEIAITELAPNQVPSVVFEALRSDPNFAADLVDAFVASIDWRGAGHASGEVIAMMETISDARDRYEDGELSLAGLRDACVSLFFRG